MNNKRNFDYKRLHPFKWFILENYPFLEDSIDVLTNYQLFCKLGEMYNKQIDAINTLGVQVEGITDWFDNLDVQEEINNKLDEMAESGELGEIISEYLNTKAVLCFDTVSEMVSATNLVDGSYARTIGFYAKNDKGGATYKIRNITNDDVVNGFSIIEIEDEENNLIAELINTKQMNLTQLGVHQDGISDDSDLLQAAINYAATNDIEIFGTYNPTIISKSIYIPYNVKINDTYFKTSSAASSFTSSYMIGVNTTNMTTWSYTYPYSDRGYMKNCKLENTDTSHMINGIYNFANNLYEDIYFRQLNVSFRTSDLYIDTVRMRNFTVNNKVGDDYALQLGYLGDQSSLDTAHMAGTLGTPNFCKIGNAHNPITLKNIIPNGKIYGETSQIDINGIHNENSSQTQFEFKNCQVSMENGYLFHVDSSTDYNINISNNTSLTLKNILFVYFLAAKSYQNASDIDVNLASNCSLTVINSYKNITKSGALDNKHKSPIKTNQDLQPSVKNVLEYNNAISYQNANQGNYHVDTPDVGYTGTGTMSTWALPSGTYYYKFMTLIDKQRMIASYWTKKVSQALTNGGNGFKSDYATQNVYRVYRGTTEDVYDFYVDMATVNNTLFDNGYMINGYKWQSRTAGDSDTFLSQPIQLYRPNKNNVVLVGNYSAAPNIGTWKRGDMIFSTASGYSGWVCTADGTPGTWKAIS